MIWTIRRSSSPFEMPRWLPGTRSDRASTAAVTSSTASLFAYQVGALALCVTLRPSLRLSCASPRDAFCVMQALQISCRPTTRVTYAASSRLCLKSWQPNVTRVKTINKRKVRKTFWIYVTVSVAVYVSVQATDTNNFQSLTTLILLSTFVVSSRSCSTQCSAGGLCSLSGDPLLIRGGSQGSGGPV